MLPGHQARRFVLAIPAALMAVIAASRAMGPVKRLRRSWEARVAIAGRSMEPGLEPGDWLLVDPNAYARRSPEPGNLILAPDPRQADLLLVKRVASVDADGGLHVLGDARDASTDSRTFGSIDPATVLGRPWFRYWPVRRAGRVT